jgi:tetratricopeptide (TPR) repeat protein
VSQNINVGQEQYQYADKLLGRQLYDSAFINYDKARSTEYKKGGTDLLFLAKTYFGMANARTKTGGEKHLNEAHEYYKKAFQLSTKSNNVVWSSSILFYWSKLYDSIIEADVAIPALRSIEKTNKAFFPVLKVLEKHKDYHMVLVAGGKNQGIFKDSRGGVLTAFSKEIEGRGNDVIGAAKVISVFNNTCKVKVYPNKKMKEEGIGLLKGDNVQLNRYELSTTYKGVLYDLNQLNVVFNRTMSLGAYRRLLIQEIETYDEQEMIMKVLLRLVKETGQSLIDGGDSTPILNKALNLERFGNKNLLESMSVSNIADIKGFFRFVARYPARYMGTRHKFDEKYAQWLLNDMILSDDENGYQTEDLLYATNFQEWLEQSQFYIDRDTGLQKTWITYLQEENAAKKHDNAIKTGEKLLKLGFVLRRPEFITKVAYETGMSWYYKAEHKTAKAYFDTAIITDTAHANAYWQRGHLNLLMDLSKEAVADFKKVLVYFPNDVISNGNIGWELFKAGKFKKASPFIIKAYELYSDEPAWGINRGHIDVVLEGGTKALSFYKEALNKTKARGDFETGLLADFDLFFENGWFEEQFKALKTQIQEEYNAHYQYKISSKEHFGKGEDEIAKENYEAALAEFYKGIEAEKLGRSIGQDQMRMGWRWVGFTYFKMKQYPKATEYYKKAWLIAKEHLGNLDRELDDLTAIDNVYSYTNLNQERAMYQQFGRAVQRKIEDHKRNKNLYLISVGQNNDETQGFRWAQNDAQAVAHKLGNDADLLFDSLIQHTLVGDQSTKAALLSGLNQVIRRAEPKDVFVFYFAGNAKNDSLILGQNQRMSLVDLSNLFLRCQAQNQVIILDAPHLDFASQIKSQTTNHTKSMMILESESSRLELPNMKSGFFASVLSRAFSFLGQDAKDGLISAKGVEHYLIEEFQKEQLGINTYFQGVDFSISRTLHSKSTDDIDAPHVEVSALSFHQKTRGGKTVKTKQVSAFIIGQALDVGGVKSVQVDGTETKVAKNGKFLISSFTPKSTTSVIVRSEDYSGNIGYDTFYFKDRAQKNNQSIDRGEGKNMALLFATDVYEGAHWDDLSNPINDAVEIARLLREQYGFKVELVTNATKKEMQNKVYEYMRKDYGPMDQLFVFVAGHGMYDETIGGQIVCKDSKHPTKDLDTYLPYWFLTSNLNAMGKCQNVFVSLDVCFGGGFFDRQEVTHYYGSTSFIDRTEFIKNKKQKRTRLFLTSGGKEYVPDGTPGGHSPFAQMFIEALESNGGDKSYLTLSDITNYMGKLQTEPRYGRFGQNDLGGDFIFEPLERSSIIQRTKKID